MSPRANRSERPLPFGQEFTPATLGRRLGENNVLPWLLRQLAENPSRGEFAELVQRHCLAHVRRDLDRRDMASHVVTALRAYGLAEDQPTGALTLTEVGSRLLVAPATELSILFARHIMTRCGGQLLVDAVLRYQLRGETPRLEDLAREFRFSPTDKSISAMRAWLSKAGIFVGTRYVVDPAAVHDVLGANVGAIYKLSPTEFEFVLGVRILELQSGSEFVSAPDAASIAEERNPDLRVPRKGLAAFVKSLESRGALESRLDPGIGGSFYSVRLLGAVRDLTESELRGVFEKSQFGFALHELEPLSSLMGALDQGSAFDRGTRGEMLAIHLCLLLGLRVVRWRNRSPASEIDLIAERTVGLAYQRWAVQVKNTAGDLTNDRVDRELGASVGGGVTHVLFVVPRSGLSGPARAEVAVRSRLSSLHVLYLTRNELAVERISLSRLLTALRGQAVELGLAKSDEADRRER